MRSLFGWGSLLGVLIVFFAGRAAQEGAATSVAPPHETPVTVDSNFPEAIEAPCLPAAVELAAADSPQLAAMSIEIPESRQWQTNLLSAYVDPAENIRDKYKKNFPATVSVSYSNGWQCSHPAEVRISGDWKDHLSVRGDRAIASMDVTLREGNINGIVRFKLLLPGTRGGDSEILATEIFRRVGILSPRTRNVLTIINGVENDMLMQENFAKELVESQNQRESAMLEVDESLLWRERAAGRPTVNGARHHELNFPRLSNSQWATRGTANRLIGWAGMQTLARALSETWTDASQPEDTLLAGGNEAVNGNLARWRVLSLALRAEHGLYTHNRRFYFDPTLGGLLPVYYDGNPALGDETRLTAPYHPEEASEHLRGVTRADIISTQTAIKDIDLDALLVDLRSAGVSIERVDLHGVLDAVEHNLRKLVDLAPARDEYAWTPKQHVGQPADLMLVFGSDRLGLQSCDTELVTCKPLTIEEERERDLLRGRLVIDGSRHVYAGPDLQAYVFGRDPGPKLRVHTPAAFLDGTPVFTHGEVDLRINEEQMKIEAKLSSEYDRIVIRDGQVAEWTINVTGPVDGNRPIEERFDSNLLTGCLTLIDTDLADVSITVQGGLCEDSLNLIRSTGTIRELIVRDSDQDAIDMDFSTIESDIVSVTDAGNDCFDVSAGTYNIETLVAQSCMDKAVSVGEQSDVSIGRADIEGAEHGLVAKDSSRLNVARAEIRQVSTCASAYRKKQEFGGAVITLNDVACPEGIFTAQQGSEIQRIQ